MTEQTEPTIREDIPSGRAAIKRHVSELLDKYAALEGMARSQTHRASLAAAVVEALLRLRRMSDHDRQASLASVLATSNAPAVLPAEWPMTRVRHRPWNGKCRRCAGKALVGHLVAWDPNSGRPSVWQHVDCELPFRSR